VNYSVAYKQPSFFIEKKLFLATAVQRQKVPNGSLLRTCLLVQHVKWHYGVLRG